MNFNKSIANINGNVRTAANFFANKLPSVNSSHSNPVETLSIEDIIYLQKYLEQIKNKKMAMIGKNNIQMDNGFLDNTTKNRANDIYDPLNRSVPVDWRTYNNNNNEQIFQNNLQTEPGSRGATNTRQGKRSGQTSIGSNNSYYNPYEYGSKQNILPSNYKETYNGPYYVDPLVLDYMGVQQPIQQSGQQPTQQSEHIRNINIESSLLQKEMTHGSGQRNIIEKEVNRFELLPFDPQDHRHIVWTDNMPRGGYSTRSDRLEI
jgi:hypothetical protein